MENSNEINVGDKVWLKSDMSIAMSVSHKTENGLCTCNWLDKSKPMQMNYHEKQLTKDEPDSGQGWGGDPKVINTYR